MVRTVAEVRNAPDLLVESGLRGLWSVSGRTAAEKAQGENAWE